MGKKSITAIEILSQKNSLEMKINDLRKLMFKDFEAMKKCNERIRRIEAFIRYVLGGEKYQRKIGKEVIKLLQGKRSKKQRIKGKAKGGKQ